MARLRLGEILIKQGLITEAQFKEALEAQKAEKIYVGEILVNKGILKEEDLAAAIGTQLLIPYASRASGMLTPQREQHLEKLIPYEFAKEHLVLPLNRNMNSLSCGIFNPFDLMMIDNLKKITGCEINFVIASRSDLLKGILEFYGNLSGDSKAGGNVLWGEALQRSRELSPASAVLVTEEGGEAELSLDKVIAKAEEAPVIKLVDLIIRQAIDERASDIHIEPFKDKIEVRYRIDGELYQIPPPAKHLHLPIISRIKILAKLDISEKRLPQDGRISAKLEDRTVDLRISSLPTVWGEKIVMRILDREAIKLNLATLGFEPSQLELIRKGLQVPYGLFFVTGPTGSGKSTTLYSALSEVIDPTKNIITAEDPVEFRIDGINQVQIRTDIGFTFAEALRSFLRQDPDIIMVGEVRDLDTAQICTRAALTGHFVLSTLHTNDAPSAITRLLDIGISTYLLTPSLTMIVAQRLGRKLCPHCKEPYEPKAEEMGDLKLKTELIYRAKGCDKCSHTGYRGRMVIAEVLMIDDDMRRLISRNGSYTELRDAARKNGMMTLFEAGIRKVEAGTTSLEEVYGVTLG
ncbi:MAG: Flp pilus assembly complex ATPase component TadA [Candidatus Omnitrophica bacterium]|nr:Flp pilus assembly complex ATPase component TadA [Candidatus Omnitrophota bacterium]